MVLRRSIDLLELEIKTERLILRSTGVADIKPIFENFTERVTRYMFPAPAKSSAETAVFVAIAMEGMSKGTELQLTIRRNDERREFVGCAGLHHPDSQTPELGVWIAEPSQHQGFAFEAIEALCKWAADELECNFLKYPVDRANARSRIIPEMLGAEIEDEYIDITPTGKRLDAVEYWIYPETL